MKIAYLDGIRFYRVLYAGIQRLLDEQEYLNKINVFPVPDGDTGTNLSFTLMGIIESIQAHDRLDLNKLCVRVADAALDNARGNSGVILAQFFQGLSNGLANFTAANTSQFSAAAQVAVDEAYQALLNPCEGTILSVMRAWSSKLQETARTSADFQHVWKLAFTAAQTALDHTPDQLRVLKDAGVVDAAGQGFVNILEGIMSYMDTGDIHILPPIETGFSTAALEMTEQNMGSLQYPFCTECILAASELDRGLINQLLVARGDSIVIAGTKQRAKIHIHTADARELFESLAQLGTVSQQKVDDMRIQNREIRSRHKIALVVDSTCDLPPEMLEQYHIHVVPVRLNFGKHQFIDRVTITNHEFYQRLAESNIHPQTSQPPPADFRRMYQFLASHFDSIISLHLPDVLSGTIQTAAAEFEKISVKQSKQLLNSLSISAGTGLIALEIAEAIQAGNEWSTIIDQAQQSIANTKIYIGLKTLDAVERGGRLSVGKKRIINWLRLNLILTVTDQGYLKPCGATIGRKHLFKKFERYVLKQVRGRAIKRIEIVHGMNPEIAEQYHASLAKSFPDVTIFVTDFCPALGVHGGVGAVGIALQFV